ncbi:MAG: thioredoxin reductase, partial [Clostridia bacterium]|nr:thioredoxin reductase [Clostridia bacterium]
MVDCIIIGTGAAGVSAALTLKALKKNFIWIGSKNLSPKIRSAEKIANYPGLPKVSGEEMTAAFLKQIEGEKIEITEGRVNGVYPAEGGFSDVRRRRLREQ